jgi:hypothetical protein
MLVLTLTVLMIQLQGFSRLFLVLSVAPLGLIGVVAADRLATLLSAATYERMRTANASPSEELPRHRHSARQRVDAAVLALVELLPCRA